MTLAKALLGAGVAGPRRVVSGSPRRKLQPQKHTRCASGVPRKGTSVKIALKPLVEGGLVSDDSYKYIGLML